MRKIDMHCDTLMAAFMQSGVEADINKNSSFMVDFQRMKEGGIMAQFFAIFMIPEYGFKQWYHCSPIPDIQYIQNCISILQNNISKNSDIMALALSASDIEQNEKLEKMSAVLTMEDGRFANEEVDYLKKIYDLGIRVLGLTWNDENCLGSPNSLDQSIMRKGLTEFGKEAVTYMQKLGILVDVSHLSDGGFFDVANISKKPFIASHSNCRAICNHPRNLTDEMIKILAEKGGVLGINFAPEFLNHNCNRDSKIVDVITMMKHVKKIAGTEVIAIGTDFDGINGNLEISDCSEIGKLEVMMKKNGFNENEIDKIMYKNVLRVMRDTIG